AHVNVAVAVEHVHGLLPLRVEGERFDRDSDDVVCSRKLQHGVGVHAGSDGEIFVVDVDLRLHGARLKVNAARKANDFSGEGATDCIHAYVQQVALMHELHVVFRYRNAETEQCALRKPHDVQCGIIRSSPALDEGPGIGVAPDHYAGN